MTSFIVINKHHTDKHRRKEGNTTCIYTYMHTHIHTQNARQ